MHGQMARVGPRIEGSLDDVTIDGSAGAGQIKREAWLRIRIKQFNGSTASDFAAAVPGVDAVLAQPCKNSITITHAIDVHARMTDSLTTGCGIGTYEVSSCKSACITGQRAVLLHCARA
jgi:hypothetical protein